MIVYFEQSITDKVIHPDELIDFSEDRKKGAYECVEVKDGEISLPLAFVDTYGYYDSLDEALDEDDAAYVLMSPEAHEDSKRDLRYLSLIVSRQDGIVILEIVE